LWSDDGSSRRRIGDRKACEALDGFDLQEYSEIIVDISALPRGVYFSLIGKLLALIDLMNGEHVPNLMISVAENPALDIAIRDDAPDEDLNFLHGFGGGIDLSAADSNEPTIWMPILGEDKLLHIKKAHGHLAPGEICPILPFPSRDPRRSDSLIINYHQFFFDEVRVEPQNIMYVPESNPFEAYKILSKTIENYHKSLQTLGGCKVIISAFSSKLLSIGALLAAYELRMKGLEVGVLNVDSQGYKMDSVIGAKKMKDDSKLFVIWLTGDPYKD
jgi:hypothetical protein